MLIDVGTGHVAAARGADTTPREGRKEREADGLPKRLDIGRGEVIRTLDPLHPMQVRYQAALRPDRTRMITDHGTRQFGSNLADRIAQQLQQLFEF